MSARCMPFMIFDPTAEHDPLETADSLVTDGGTTEESIEIEFVMEEDEDVHDGNRILVPILDTQTDDEQEYDIKRLLGTASSLARSRDGVVHLVNILLFPAQTPLDTVARDSQIDKERKKARDDVTELLNWAEDNGFRDLMQGSVCLAHKEARTLHQLVDGGEYDAVFLGTRKQTSQRQRLLRGDTIERFLETATCDVYVERFGLEPYVEELGSSAEQAHRLLLAVADSVHSDLAVDLAHALATAAGARIDIVHCVSTDATKEEMEAAKRLIEDVETRLGDVPEASSSIVKTEHAPEEIIHRSNNYDVTILGATRETLLQQFISGSLPERVRLGAKSTVLMAKRGEN